jgi:lipopolysaccharide transport system permease protein
MTNIATAPTLALAPKTGLSAAPASQPVSVLLDLSSDMSFASRSRAALRDVADAASMWRLALLLAWLDIKLRYRGSVLGPLWLTLSTGVMVLSLGILYSTLFKMDVSAYLPFLALSLVLWNFLAALVQDACTCFTQAEAMVRSARMPFTLHAERSVVRNLIIFAHNVVVVVITFAWFERWPGAVGLLALPGLLLWALDAVMVSLLLGAVCARFRDVPPIVGSVMQIAFFVSAIIWTPDQVGGKVIWLQLNPFFALIEIVRAPLLGELPGQLTWISAGAWSVVLSAIAWSLFTRVRGRLAFWL